MNHGTQVNLVGKIINGLNKYSIGIEVSNPGHKIDIKIFKNK